MVELLWNQINSSSYSRESHVRPTAEGRNLFKHLIDSLASKPYHLEILRNNYQQHILLWDTLRINLMWSYTHWYAAPQRGPHMTTFLFGSFCPRGGRFFFWSRSKTILHAYSLSFLSASRKSTPPPGAPIVSIIVSSEPSAPIPKVKYCRCERIYLSEASQHSGTNTADVSLTASLEPTTSVKVLRLVTLVGPREPW